LALHFSNYSFLVHHPVNQDDWHLLTHTMASDFTVACQYSQRILLFFLLRIKLNANLHKPSKQSLDTDVRIRLSLVLEVNDTPLFTKVIVSAYDRIFDLRNVFLSWKFSIRWTVVPSVSH
jgi:hypothetical protein